MIDLFKNPVGLCNAKTRIFDCLNDLPKWIALNIDFPVMQVIKRMSFIFFLR